jgi:hypothetical protein
MVECVGPVITGRLRTLSDGERSRIWGSSAVTCPMDRLTGIVGHDRHMGTNTNGPLCNRCGRPVDVSLDKYDVFEQMHYVCFHYEFEHDPTDPDEECGAGGCPSAAVNPRPERRPETEILVRELLHEGKSPLEAIEVLRAQGVSTDVAKALVDSRLPSDVRLANEQLRNQAEDEITRDEQPDP